MGLRKMWRQVRGKERPHNILALSDIHLGVDLKMPKAGGRMPGANILDRQLAAFLDHHRQNRHEGKPWKLILNGDIVDFVAITLTPPEGEAPFEVRPEERLFGLDPNEEKCIWKLRQVFERHAGVFDALARFALDGNFVVLIRGNHDAEFSWPGVKAEFRRLLAQRGGASAETQRAVDQQIEFHDWFYLEPGFLYAEHGNAHDRYCMQEDFLAPYKNAQAEKGGAFELPMSSKVMRFFANKHVSQSDMCDADTWGFKEFVRWTIRMGNPLQIAADYFIMVWRLLYPIVQKSLRLGQAAARAAGIALHKSDDEALSYVSRQLSHFAQDDKRKAARLLQVASRPAEQSLFDSMQLFYLDRMALALLCLVSAAGVVLETHGWVAKLAGVGAVGMIFGILNAFLARYRQTDAHPMLRQAARRVAQIFDVRFIVMGHSHRMVDESVGGRTRYFNLGSWTVPAPHKPFEGFPHLVVAGGKAELRRWSAPVRPAEPVRQTLRDQVGMTAALA